MGAWLARADQRFVPRLHQGVAREATHRSGGALAAEERTAQQSATHDLLMWHCGGELRACVHERYLHALNVEVPPQSKAVGWNDGLGGSAVPLLARTLEGRMGKQSYCLSVRDVLGIPLQLFPVSATRFAAEQTRMKLIAYAQQR